MGGVADGSDGFGKNPGQGQIGREENKDAKEKRQTGEEDLKKVFWFLEPIDEADQEKKIDGQEAIGQLEEGKQEKEMQKEAFFFTLIATEAIESAEKRPERVKLEMG